ncbi:MAG: pseudouridine synthase [Betaproteobacteria bacterium]|nr:pseudouridine synthase [Betaproteobacteria bacterium]
MTPELAALLPTKRGVGPSVIALPAGPWRLVIDYLEYRFPAIPREEIARRMREGDVRDDRGEWVLPDAAYRAHQKLYYYRHIENEPRIPFDEKILFEDELIVVADKPHFLPVTPGGRYLQETLLVRLKRKLGIDALAPMHRIDRETAGLVLFTKQPHTRGIYQALFSQKTVRKQYEAVARWREDLPLPLEYKSRLVNADHFMRMREEAGEANAETRIELIERRGELARYALFPVSGKRHQLRVQMAALGLPILNDQIYPHHVAAEDLDGDYSRPLQLLAKGIGFRDPVTGSERIFESEFELHTMKTEGSI